jgi:hypothetical protein
MKKNTNKLLDYSSLATTVLASSALNAQAVGIDVNPDVILTPNSTPYSLDFNADLTPDLNFTLQTVTGSQSYQGIPFTYEGIIAGVQIPVGNGLVGLQGSGSGTSAPGSFTITALDNGTPISVNETFGSSSQNALAVDIVADAGALGTFPYTFGPFLDASYKFLGAKFQVGTEVHYGWVQLSVTPGIDSLIIHGYGYNQTPNQPINAGEGGDPAGLGNVTITDKVTIKTTLNEATVNVTPDLIGGEIKLVSLTGQDVRSVVISDINTVISFEGINTGIYTVHANFNGGSVNKRVYVK